MGASGSFRARALINRRLDNVGFLPPRNPHRLLVNIPDVLRGTSVESVHLLTNGGIERARIVLAHNRQRQMNERWGKFPYIPNLLGHPLLFVERLGLTDPVAHAGLHLPGDSLVWPESLLSEGGIKRVEIVYEAF